MLTVQAGALQCDAALRPGTRRRALLQSDGAIVPRPPGGECLRQASLVTGCAPPWMQACAVLAGLPLQESGALLEQSPRASTHSGQFGLLLSMPGPYRSLLGDPVARVALEVLLCHK